MTNTSIQPPHVLKLFVGSAVLIAAYVLKTYYSQAGSDDLAWIIGPTVFLTETVSNLSFVREAGYGWVDFQHHVVIAPACAGVNFLIITFCMSSFQILWRRKSPKELMASIIVAGCISYIFTLFANTIRIILSDFFFRFEINSNWLTPEAVHRIVGTSVYYLFLFFCFYLVGYCSKSRGPKKLVPDKIDSPINRQLVFFVPLFWYLLLSLGVPFVNDAYKKNPDLFLGHLFSVGGVTMLLTLILSMSFCCTRNVFAQLKKAKDKLNDIHFKNEALK